MAFELEHWSDPRKTIGFDLNPMQYQAEGALLAFRVASDLELDWATMAKSCILDFGCGTGRVARVLSMMFWRVVGYDPQPACIDLAKNECLPFGVEDATKFKNLFYFNTLPEEKFDYVCSFGVFEHLDNEQQIKTWSQLFHCLRPGGKAVITWSPSRNTALVNILKFDARGLKQRIVRGVYTAAGMVKRTA